MPLPERSRFAELSVEDHFTFGAVHERETAELNAWLKEEANLALGKPNPTRESAYAHGENLVSEIRQVFGREDPARNVELINRASDGRLEAHVPSSGAILAYLALFLIAFIAETAIGFVQYTMGDSSGVVIVIAVALAIGGAIAGAGLATVLERANPLPRELSGDSGTMLSASTSIGLAVAGLVIIAVAAWVRTGGDENGADLIVAFTVAVALMIAVCEALWIHKNKRRQFLRQQMFRAQVWFATDEHRKNSDRNVFLNNYRRAVDAIWDSRPSLMKE